MSTKKVNLTQELINDMTSEEFKPLLKVMREMQEIKTGTPEAKENEISMTNSKGEKIIYTLTKKLLEKLKLRTK
jgi:hypothetical protein